MMWLLPLSRLFEVVKIFALCQEEARWMIRNR
jgi:hypothetical protein